MWHKCGTKNLNEINRVKKSVFFFGSGIYQFSSVFYAKYQFSSDTAGRGSYQQAVRKYYQLAKSPFVPKICGEFWLRTAVLQGLPSICQ